MAPPSTPSHVTLSPVSVGDKSALRTMFDAYLIELAAMVDPRRLQGDPTDYGYFDAYWQEAARRPFWILDDGARAGFLLINAYSPSGLGCDQAIAEFCIAPEHRRAGLGMAAAKAAFGRATGRWELQVFRANPGGMAFWPRAIAQVAPFAWEVLEQPDRVIHRFSCD